MTNIANQMAYILSKNGIIKKDEESIYAYGTEVTLMLLSSVVTILAIGVVFSKLLEMLIFITVYSVLRGYAGGYHASSHFKCYLCSVFIFMVVLCCIIFLPTEIKHIILLPTLLINDITLFLIAPTQNLVNPKTTKELKNHKIKMLILIAIINIGVIVFWKSSFFKNGFISDICFTVVCALIAVAILSIINLVQILRRDKNENKK